MINIPAILIANGMGLVVLFAVYVGGFWKFKEAGTANRGIALIFFASIMNCIVDPICFLADGKPGLLNQFLVYSCNTLLYFGGALTAIAWIQIISKHMNIRLSAPHRVILKVIFAVIIIVLIVNLFTPILFHVDENNVYGREFGYIIHQSLYFVFMLDGLILYLIARYKSGILKYFPVWAFLIPSAMGILIQVFFYGVSTATPFTTISIICIILCMQNEFMIRDKLTGLYNRFYLTTVERNLLKSPKLKYTAIMLDINGFKKINDTFGHKVGDDVLLKVAALLIDAVGKIGEIIRYAGDEFVIILNTQNNVQVENIIAHIHELLDGLKVAETSDLKLSVSIGYHDLNLNEYTMDEFMDIIDKLMYEDKKSHYMLNPAHDRRKRDGE